MTKIKAFKNFLMGIRYKHINTLRTVPCAVFLMFLTAPVSAQDPLFTVEGVKVDVTAENAIKAREEAFNQAQIKAFEELQTRMLPEGEISTKPTPDPLTISSFIKDFEITNEQLSAVRYVGTYTFRFQDRSVRRHFKRAGKTYTDVSSKSLLLLPFLQVGSASTIWSPYNSWLKAWKRAGNLGGVVPLQLPLGDLDDVKDIKDDQALSYAPEGINSLLKRYSANEAVVAIALPDEELVKIREDDLLARGRVTIEIYRTDRRRPELVQQVSIIADGAQTKGELYDAAVLRVQRALKNDWKSKTIVKTAESNRLEVIVPIESLQQWVKVETRLKSLSVIDEMMVRSLTPQNARVDLLYQGDIQRLVVALGQAGMTLKREADAQGQPINILSAVRIDGGYSDSSDSYGAKGFKVQF